MFDVARRVETLLATSNGWSIWQGGVGAQKSHTMNRKIDAATPESGRSMHKRGSVEWGGWQLNHLSMCECCWLQNREGICGNCKFDVATLNSALLVVLWTNETVWGEVGGNWMTYQYFQPHFGVGLPRNSPKSPPQQYGVSPCNSLPFCHFLELVQPRLAIGRLWWVAESM